MRLNIGDNDDISLLLPSKHVVYGAPYIKVLTRKDQFGREKYFFAEETLFYPLSDCEDRAIFFAILIRNLLGLDVIGLDYPGHIATAVHFSNDVSWIL